MRSFSQELLTHSLEIWKSVCQEIEDSFGFSPKETPSSVAISSDEDDLENLQPGKLRNNRIIVNSRVPNYSDLLPITITKLCFQSALPQDLLCPECIDDLSFEFARQRISSDILRNQWESLWSEHTPQVKISSVIEYHPCTAYTWLFSVAGESGLITIVREITHRARNQIPLSFEDYLIYFSKRVKRFENTLDATELTLVKHLLEQPDIAFNELAKISGLSSEWVSTKISQLQKRMILRRFNHVPFSQLDISVFHILIRKISGQQDLFSILKECPFLYSYRKVMSGDWDALVTFCIPKNQDSMDLVNVGFDLMAKKGFDLQIHHISSSGVSSCFDYYSTKNKQWDIPWELLTVQLQRIQSDGLAASIPRIDTLEQKTDIRLDELDIKILQCVRGGLYSVSKIREHLRVGQHRVANKLRRLREEKLIVNRWEIHNIGLSEHVVVFTKETEIGEAISAWSLRLPRSIISFSDSNNLMLLVDLPKGGAFGLASAIGEIQAKVSIGILSSMMYGSWGFPSSLWDFKFQKWQCPKKRIENWIDCLE